MPGNLGITVNANVSNLQAQAAVAEASVRKMTASIRADARSLATSFDAVKFDRLTKEIETLGQKQASLTAINRQAAAANSNLAQSFTQSHGAAAQLSFQINDLITQIASGTSVQQAFIQQGGQIFQVFQTNAGAASLMGRAVTFLTNPLGVLATVGVTVTGALAAMAFQAYQIRQTLGGLQADLLATGRSGGGSLDGLSQEAENLANKLQITKRAAADLLAAGDARTLGPQTVDRGRVVDLATRFGASQRAGGKDITDVDLLKQWTAALADGAKGVIKLSDSYNIAQTAAEQMLKSGNEVGALKEAWAQFSREIDRMGGNWTNATTEYNKYRNALEQVFNLPAITARLFGMDVPPQPTDRPSAGTGLALPVTSDFFPGATQQEANVLAEIRRRESAGVYDQFHANRQRVTSLADVERFSGPSHAFGAYGFQPGTYRDMAKALGFDPNDISRANQDRAALELLRRYGPNATQSWAASGPYPTSGLPGKGAETQFADKAAREQAFKETAQAYANQQIDARNSLQRQAEDAQKHYDALRNMVRDSFKDSVTLSKDQIDAEVSKDERVVAALHDLNQKKAALYDQDTARAITSLRAQEAATVDTLQKIKAQQESVRTLQARGAPITELESAQNDLAAMRRQLFQQETELHVGSIRERMAATNDPAIRRQAAEEILRIRQTGGAGVPGRSAEGLAPIGIDRQAVQQAQSELAGLQRQERQDTVAQAQDRLNTLRTTGQLEIQQVAAQEGLRVAQRLESQQQALAKEAAATDAFYQKQRDAAQALVETAEAAGLSAREVEKFKDAVKQIDTQRATSALQFATRDAEANKALVDKWVAPVKDAFNQIGSTIESSISGILTRRTTWAQGLRNIQDSMISGAVSATSGVLSKLGAKALGAEQGEGIGEFLGGKLLNSLGIGDLLGIGGQSANTAALAANTAAIAANTAALGVSAGASGLGGTASLVGGGGGIFSFLSGAGALAFSRGGIVPSAAGGWALPSFAGAQPALLHSREMVLPQKIAGWVEAASNRGEGGGGSTVINLSAIDSRSGAQFLMSHAETIGRAVSRSRRNFAPA